jgi:YD repeat-containing protein
MATLNFLTGAVEGKLGETTGAKWKNKNVLKSRIDGRVPMEKIQIDSRIAFESLNRLAVDFSRLWWKELGLSSAKMLKHNAVAHFMRPAVESHIFEPGKCLDSLPDSTIFDDVEMILKSDYSSLYTNIKPTIKFSDAQDIMCYVACISSTGQITGYTSFNPQAGPQIVPMDVQAGQPIMMVAFSIYKLYGKLRREKIYGGFSVGYTYDTSERLSGDTWIDGKPIYMKVIQATIPTANQTITIPHGIFTLGNPVKIEGMLKRASGDWLTVSFSYENTSDYNVGAWMSQNNLNCRVGANVAVPANLIVIIHYTKL